MACSRANFTFQLNCPTLKWHYTKFTRCKSVRFLLYLHISWTSDRPCVRTLITSRWSSGYHKDDYSNCHRTVGIQQQYNAVFPSSIIHIYHELRLPSGCSWRPRCSVRHWVIGIRRFDTACWSHLEGWFVQKKTSDPSRWDHHATSKHGAAITQLRGSVSHKNTNVVKTLIILSNLNWISPLRVVSPLASNWCAGVVVTALLYPSLQITV
jgi:hypothetical protein